MAIEIVVSPALHGQRFEARWLSEVLVTSRTPLLSAARELQRRGVRDDAELWMRHAGSSIVAMRTTVGAAARLTMAERDQGSGPRYEPYSALSVRPVPSPAAWKGSGGGGVAEYSLAGSETGFSAAAPLGLGPGLGREGTVTGEEGTR